MESTILPSLLAVFAHPDDESLLAGGVLAQHHAAGARTAVVTATWASESRRAPELAEALAVLGAGSPRLLGYNDARNPEAAPGRPRLVYAPLDEVVGRLVAHIRDFRPDIVVGHDALGQLTGHPDHVRTHQITLLASKRPASPTCTPTRARPGSRPPSTPPPTPSPASACSAHCSKAWARASSRCRTRT
ncbi:1D-myo-inositol 2-acetamido-2-deoxy-alpha-D-glucopyranoside deacetylase [Streptomyces sp. enrichment culture]